MRQTLTRYGCCVVLGMLVGILMTNSPSRSARADEKQPTNEETIKLLKTFASEFVHITPGCGKYPCTFQMGSATGEASERPVHCVAFNHQFWIAKYEVPQNLYQAVMGTNPSRWKGPRNSVENIDFKEVTEFCRRATQLMREAKLLSQHEEIRLPSEAEWEYCCRAGTTTAYSFGDEATAEGDQGKKATRLDAYAWHTGNAAGNDPPVGALKPNPWGLYDMHGYLWEFVSDGWKDDYRCAATDGKSRRSAPAEAGDAQVVLRGGSWKDRYHKLRSSSRRAAAMSLKDDAVGFRCVKACVSGR